MFKFPCFVVLISLKISFCINTDSNDLLLDDDYICKFKKCMYKCCSKNQYMDTTSDYEPACIDIDGEFNMDFSKVQLYDNVDYTRASSKKLGDVFLLKHSVFLNDSFANLSLQPEVFGMNTYLIESGVLEVELPNTYIRWIPVETDFCIDYASKNGSMPTIKFWAILTDTSVQPRTSEYYSIGLIISSVFLALVLIVYAILPELRNIGGMVLMAYVISLLGAFVALIVVQKMSLFPMGCIILSTTTYFFFLSAFSWMNVMSFDIWWTFRGYAKARPIHRRGEKFKFFMYCLYAWGVPLAMAIAFVVINDADLTDMPWFIKPNVPKLGCFLNGGQQLVYLYIPMLILILCNWMLYLMTAFNIWRLSRGSAMLNSEAAGNPAAHRTQKQRLMVYLKLSVIMGINWILEVISSFSPELKIWVISDLYNVFIGVTIFLIFICKQSIYNKLLIRYRGFRQYKLPKRSLTSSFTLESNLTQDSAQNYCSNPRGERKRSLTQKPSFEI